MYIFPYDKVKKGENIVLYGAGKVGREYIEQIEKNHYCEIAGVIDRSLNSIEGYNIVSINQLREISYDKKVVSVVKKQFVDEIVEELTHAGIDADRVVMATFLSENSFIETEENDSDELRCAVINRYGLGDVVMDLPLIESIRKQWNGKVFISHISKFKDLFEDSPLVDECVEEIDHNGYDLIMEREHRCVIRRWNIGKFCSKAPLLYQFCVENIELDKELGNVKGFRRIYDYADFYGVDRIGIGDPKNILMLDNSMRQLLFFSGNAESILDKFNLSGKKYITFNNEAGLKNGGYHTKIWPRCRYEELAHIIKEKYPDAVLVQVGTECDYIRNVDYNLCGKTTMNELKIILKFASMHISSEGGTVHMRHFLGERSAVVFGPTDTGYFGYDEDFRICKRTCKKACNYITNSWMTKCPMEYGSALCMDNITAENVFDAIREYLDDNL